jgi:Tfp pilus assembly protein PilZ
MTEHGEGSARSAKGPGAPSGGRRQILTIGLEPELYRRIEALLNRSYFEVDKVPGGEGGRVLCGAIGFDLLLVRFPLPDMEVEALLAKVRLPGSPCAKCQIVLLADAERLSAAQRLVGAGADIALAAESTGEYLSEFAARLLNVAPRVASRVMVQLQARIGDGENQALCQTVDLSTSGLFVRTDERYPLGTIVNCRLLLPDEREPVAGTASVVRHAAGGSARLEGIGLRWIEFRPGSAARLQSYLERSAAGRR